MAQSHLHLRLFFSRDVSRRDPHKSLAATKRPETDSCCLQWNSRTTQTVQAVFVCSWEAFSSLNTTGPVSEALVKWLDLSPVCPRHHGTSPQTTVSIKQSSGEVDHSSSNLPKSVCLFPERIRANARPERILTAMEQENTLIW